MSYRLIDANALAMSCKEVNDMPCIYADLPNGLDGGHYVMTVTATEFVDVEGKTYLEMDFHHAFTPEQAIAATLGNMSATVDNVLSLLNEMNEQGRIEYADYSQLHDAIATTLGSEREKQLEKLVQDWQVLYDEPDYGDCIRLRKRMQELGIEVIDE